MEFHQHYSGSKGNLYTVEHDGHVLIIDPGVCWRDTRKVIDSAFIVDGCLVTHGHKDHCKSAAKVMMEGIPVYASAGTIDKMAIPSCVEIVDDTVINIGPFNVFPFETTHDCEGSLGFVIECGNEAMLFATDTYDIHQDFFSVFDVIAIECNHDLAIIQQRVDNCDMHQGLAERVAGSHMDIGRTIDYLTKECLVDECRELHLLHPSADNLDKEDARLRVHMATGIEPIFCGDEANG